MKLRMLLTGLGFGAVLGLAGYPSSITPTPGEGLASAAEHEEANESNHEENDPAAEDHELTVKIKQEKAEGKDVSAAIAHQKQGEAAMKKGNSKAALEHFEMGEKALGEGEEHEGKEHEKGEKSGY